MSVILTDCNHCQGKGKVELSPPLAKTLALLTDRKSVTAPEAYDLLGETEITHPAINRRFEELRRRGLVERERDGKAWRYSKPKKKK